ncbi:22451_t:CDS:2, partial [Gigaspora rosea]
SRRMANLQGIFCPITSHPQVFMSSSSLQTAIIAIAQPSENLEEFYPNARGRPKKALEISKTNSATFDNFMTLPSQNITRILSCNEILPRGCASDTE